MSVARFVQKTRAANPQFTPKANYAAKSFYTLSTFNA